MKLGGEKARLEALRGSLKMMPSLTKFTKASKLKELQKHINKVGRRHQWRMTHLDELQGTTEKWHSIPWKK